jgi:DNA-binding transcriptional LysR family regulator
MGLIKEAFDANGLALPSERVSAASILLRNQLLATGRYVTMLPDSILRYTAKQYALKVLPIDLRIKPWPIAILTLKSRTVGPVVQLFVEHLRAVAKTISHPRRQVRK